ncbi:MAG: 16S rRNA (uracil(1498)-N(3))-methyltransferase [Gammaproteobacteria bacterium]|nr:16S rRNA (uracil(1498)-N(3))-methyltransferase [Gammaproteobacteria bacterium]
MHIPRIHIPSQLDTGQTITLDKEPASHISRVLRMKPGDALTLFNGGGGEYNASITNIERHDVTVQIEQFTDKDCESPIRISLVQGISRGERMDYTIQKAVELGVYEIIPVFTQRGVVQLKGDRLLKKERHWQAVAISACEQCGRNTVPVVHAPETLKNWLAKDKLQPTAIVLDPLATQNIKQAYSGDTSITLLAGPEGGLSENEMEIASEHGFTGIQLGPRVLRTETAALAAIAALQTLFGDYL